MEKPNHHQEIKDEIRNIAPGLTGMPHRRKTDDIPFRYFDQLSDRVIQKIKDQKSSEKPTQPAWLEVMINLWYGRRMWVVSLASVLTVIFVAGLWFTTDRPAQVMDFSQIHPLEARTYLLSCAADLDDSQLSLLNQQGMENDLMPVSDEELEGIIDDYLYQFPSDNQLN